MSSNQDQLHHDIHNMGLSYLQTIPNSEDVSLKDLSLKTAMLGSLVSAQRGQTIHYLNLNDMISSETSITFELSKPVKQSKPGSLLRRGLFRGGRLPFPFPVCPARFGFDSLQAPRAYFSPLPVPLPISQPIRNTKETSAEERGNQELSLW